MFRSSSRSFVVVGALSLPVLLTGCSKKPAETPTAGVEESSPEKSEPAAAPDQKSSSIEIDESIVRACGLSQNETYFQYNSSRLDPAAEKMLNKLVACFTTGPLAQRTMNLVGHADPRGEDEYNMTLGGSRAGSVESSLLDKGLPKNQVMTSSRGELDATGTDEESWATDRKVAILLAR